MTASPPPGRAFRQFSGHYRPLLEQRLAAALPGGEDPLSRAMRAALLSPGKRIRALVAMAAGLVFRGPEDALIDFGAAVEAVHAASLIFDDLPSMDNATLRRGAPALHLQFGEGTAVLAGLSLLNRAFEVLGRINGIPPRIRCQLVEELAHAAGEAGCCRGQQADLDSDPEESDLEELEKIHSLKTGVLFVAAARGGAITARASAEEVEALSRYAKNLGLAFQIVDDLLEESGNAETTGKRAHGEGHRANFARILGSDTARVISADLTEAAAQSVSLLGKRARPLVDLAYALRDRKS